MSDTDNAAPSADEQPKQAVAKKVVTPKRRYFFPSTGVSIVATSLDSAQTMHQKQLKKSKKVGDG